MSVKPEVPRSIAAEICIVAAAICVAYGYVRQDLSAWWRGYGGGIPYVLFWCTFWFVIFPVRRAIIPICVAVTATTCLLEFLQLWKPVWLQEFRATRFGAALIGSGFTWQDFPPYFVGGILGYFVLLAVCKRWGDNGDCATDELRGL